MSEGASPVVLVVKNPPVNAGDIRDTDSIPGSERPPRRGHSNPLKYSCLGNPTDRGAWWSTVYRVAQSQTLLKRLNSAATCSRGLTPSCCSVAQLRPALCNPMDCSTPGFLVPHHLPELAQTHVHWVGDAIQPSHSLSPSPAFNLSQHHSQMDLVNLWMPDGPTPGLKSEALLLAHINTANKKLTKQNSTGFWKVNHYSGINHTCCYRGRAMQQSVEIVGNWKCLQRVVPLTKKIYSINYYL